MNNYVKIYRAYAQVYHHRSDARWPGRWIEKTKYFLNLKDAEAWLEQYYYKFSVDGKLVPVTQEWQYPRLTVKVVLVYKDNETC